ncbi:MAG: hypothetical protein Terrestrivirus4_219 [Terrestrivirus sp.]|uniref:Uncharacterized protein n=1 Tax=Terrestrivirus sp. TaxID=2487775 RepID=A0A3G4ZQA7_9VIRU|nr:MAG: hypothetical protein Terrestrivirus4_219 [Terrestrivirus sp.]
MENIKLLVVPATEKIDDKIMPQTIACNSLKEVEEKICSMTEKIRSLSLVYNVPDSDYVDDTVRYLTYSVQKKGFTTPSDEVRVKLTRVTNDHIKTIFV